jgi:mRNA-degrading endonuclease toxin of MazEF toxin-antitoxin module
VPSIVRGRIVFPKTAIPDPQGRNPKAGRPFVVISRDDEIQKGERIRAVGITGELNQSPADHYVHLPHGPTAKTHLRQESAALCTWLIAISQDQVEIGKGYVRADLVEEIVMKVLEFKSIPKLQGHESDKPRMDSDQQG